MAQRFSVYRFLGGDSIYPCTQSGIIKVSDRFGFERCIVLLSAELLDAAEDDIIGFVDDLLASLEEESKFDQDLIALGQRRWLRTMAQAADDS